MGNIQYMLVTDILNIGTLIGKHVKRSDIMNNEMAMRTYKRLAQLSELFEKKLCGKTDYDLMMSDKRLLDAADSLEYALQPFVKNKYS